MRPCAVNAVTEWIINAGPINHITVAFISHQTGVMTNRKQWGGWLRDNRLQGQVREAGKLTERARGAIRVACTHMLKHPSDNGQFTGQCNSCKMRNQ